MENLKFLIILLLSSVSIVAQDAIVIESNSYGRGKNVTNEDVEKVLERLPEFMERYRTSSMFLDENALNTFQDLFSAENDIVIFDDIFLSPNSPTIELVDYINNAQSYLVNSGGFDVVEIPIVTITEILKDSRQNVIINIKFDKITPGKIDDGGQFKPHPNMGYTSSMRAKISLDPYNTDEDGISFLKITGLSVNKKVEKVKRKQSSLKTPLPQSFVGLYSLGNISNSNVLPGAGYIESTSLSSYGLGLRLRRKAFSTMRDGATLFDLKSNFIIGANIERTNVKSKISAVDLSSIDGFVVGSSGEGEDIPIQVLDPRNEEFSMLDASSVYIPSGLDNTQNSEENFSLMNISLQLGMEFRVVRFVDDRVYLGIGAFGNYISTIGNGTVDLYTEGLQLPTDENFPSPSEYFENISSSEIDEAYKVEGQLIRNNQINPESHFSYGVFVSPVYHKFINSSLGLEIGLDLQYSMTSMFNNVAPIDGKPADGYILEAPFKEDRTKSLLEDHFGSNKQLKMSLRFGIYYKL